MPNRYATVSGNWSDITIWDNYLTLGYPTASDVVRPNGFNVTIDQNITITQLTNNAASPAVAGGRFFLNDGITITGSSSTTVLLSQFTYGNTIANTGSMVIISGSNSATIIGNVSNASVGNFTYVILKQGLSNLTITGSLISAGAAAYQIPIIDYSAGNTYVSGTLQGGPATNVNPAIRMFNSSSVYVVGDVIGSGLLNGPGISVEGGTTGSIEVYGNVRAGTNSAGIAINSGTRRDIKVVGNVIAGAGANSFGINLAGVNSTLQVTGNVQAGVGASGIISTIACIISVSGSVSSNVTSPGIQSTSTAAVNTFTGPFYNLNQRNAIFAPNLQLISGSTPVWTFDTETALEQRTLYTQNFPGNFPSTTNVRQGVTFGDTGQFTGTLVIPSASNVLRGVPVDNTTGSASFTTQNVWNVSTGSLTATGSIGERLRNASTVAIDANLITLTGSL